MTTVQNEQESERVAGYLGMTQSGTHRMAELSPVLTRSPLEENKRPPANEQHR